MKHVLLVEELPARALNPAGREDCYVEEQLIAVGREAALRGYARVKEAPAVTKPVYDQWLRMNPLVWKAGLQRGLAEGWAEAFYRCRTCEGWSIARPGCSACQDTGEVRASSTGDYPVFLFEVGYQPGGTVLT